MSCLLLAVVEVRPGGGDEESSLEWKDERFCGCIVDIGNAVGVRVVFVVKELDWIFKWVWVFGGTLELVGSAFIILARFAQAEWTVWKKV